MHIYLHALATLLKSFDDIILKLSGHLIPSWMSDNLAFYKSGDIIVVVRRLNAYIGMAAERIFDINIRSTRNKDLDRSCRLRHQIVKQFNKHTS